MHYIYKITNLINNKVYIGQTKDFNQRWRQHKLETKKAIPSMIVNKAMKKYGVDNFIFEVIVSCLDQDAANDCEELIIIQEQSHITLDKGYNVSNGGSTAPKTEAWRQKMKDHWADPEYRKKMKLAMPEPWNKGIETGPQSLELIAKRSLAMMGHVSGMKDKFQTEETKQKISQALIGIKRGPMSQEYREKISISRKGRIPWNKGIPCAEETKNKLSQALNGREAWNKGVPQTEETRLKNSLSHMGQPAWNKGLFSERQCSIEDCDKKHKCKGLCKMHYMRIIREKNKEK